VAGLTFVHKLTGLSLDGVDYMPEGVDEGMLKIAIESATNAVKSPTEVTKSAYTDAPVFDESKYTKLELSWTALGYWSSGDGIYHHKIVTGAGNSKQFYASKMFTKADLPVGSVIEVANGWQYRPEAWITDTRHSSRPDNVTTTYVKVTEEWWGNYTLRAFNVSNGSALNSNANNPQFETAKSKFTIYIPKKD
jgi:hypothetical protein